MSKHFRPWNIDQTLLLPPNVRDFVPKDHVSRFIVGLVRESLDLKAIMCSYVSGLGQPPFDPRIMVSLGPKIGCSTSSGYGTKSSQGRQALRERRHLRRGAPS